MLERIKNLFKVKNLSSPLVLNEKAPVVPPYGARPEESVEMKAIYALTIRYFNQAKAYLDPNLKIKELARSIHTNRLYLSRTINVCSGYNYKQFVNWFRIKDAVDLIDKDGRIKMEEVARLSGFNNQPTFNLAFKYHMGITPTQYKDRNSKGRKTLHSVLSKKLEQVPL